MYLSFITLKKKIITLSCKFKNLIVNVVKIIGENPVLTAYFVLLVALIIVLFSLPRYLPPGVNTKMDLVSLIHSLEFQEYKLKQLNPAYRNYFHGNLYNLCAFKGNTSELQSFCEKLQKELHNLNHLEFKSHYGKVFFREMLWAIKRNSINGNSLCTSYNSPTDSSPPDRNVFSCIILDQEIS
jgi:hypothetical protein